MNDLKRRLEQARTMLAKAKKKLTRYEKQAAKEK
jgi:hypothetical protein